MSDCLEFRFKFVDLVTDDPYEEGFRCKQGMLKDGRLTLGEMEVSLDSVVAAVPRFGWLYLGVRQANGNVVTMALAITRGTSSQWAETHRQTLQKKGREKEFRVTQCPYCTSVVILTGFPGSPQFYCGFCDSIVTVEGTAPKGEETHRECGLCGYYAQPRDFTVFYAHILLFNRRYWGERIHCCSGCMRSTAWFMFFANVPLVVGVPFATWQLARVCLGGSVLSPGFAGLDAANVLARKRQPAALEAYVRIEERMPHCAGVRFNHGLALESLGRTEEAAALFMQSLQDCSNFGAAYHHLADALKRLGREKEVDALREVYKDIDDA